MSTNKWSNGDTTIAFALYCQMPFGQIHSRNAKIIDVANKIGRSPNALAMKMLNLASLDPKIRESGRTGLNNVSQTDKRIWDKFHQDWDAAIEKANVYLTLDEEDEQAPQLETDPQETTAIGEVTQRRKQAFFRKSVLASYGNVCCISGLSHKSLLVAGHIVPWSEDRKNRLNPQNGICLSVLYDKVFDLGYITITPKYEVVVSETFKNEATDRFSKRHLHSIHGQKIMLPEKFLPSSDFLEYHNNHKFVN